MQLRAEGELEESVRDLGVTEMSAFRRAPRRDLRILRGKGRGRCGQADLGEQSGGKKESRMLRASQPHQHRLFWAARECSGRASREEKRSSGRR
jgi:hypothetical protein